MSDHAFIAPGVARTHFAGRKPRLGFTLVELLAATAIFVILMIITAQILTLTNDSTLLSNHDADAAAQARLAFDRIGVDLAALIDRPDADFEAGNYDSTNVYNPFLLIFSSVGSSSSSNRSISTVSYAIQSSTDNYNRLCLVRAATIIPWAGADFMGNEASGYPYSISNLLPAATAYDVLSPGVICLCVGFQLYPDGQPVTLMDGSTVPNGPTSIGQIVYSPPIRSVTSPGSSYVDVSRIAAIVIGVVTIDLNDLGTLSSLQVQAIVKNFTTAPAIPSNGQLPVQVWEPTIENLSSAGIAGIPPPVLKALQVYQRVYPITSYRGSLQ
jgi:prepilin-type N-terminal cleavage/methylation domain-containing protein